MSYGRERNLPRHKFTPAESIKGATATKRNRVKLAKEIKKLTGMEIDADIAMTFLSNPAVMGTLLYIGVGFLRNLDTVQTTQNSNKPSFLSEWEHNFGAFLGTVGIPVNSLAGTTTIGGIGLDALQLALLAYIASGGNLAGILSSATGFVSKLLPAAAAAGL